MMGALRRHFIIPRGTQATAHEAIPSLPEQWASGPAPDKIDRPGDLRMGIVGRGVNSFPPTGGLLYVGHVPLVHLMRSPTLQPGNTFDDRSNIPGIFAGDPQ